MRQEAKEAIQFAHWCTAVALVITVIAAVLVFVCRIDSAGWLFLWAGIIFFPAEGIYLLIGWKQR